jgi:secreted Zn-dependent insulinase-like peptidase
MEFAEGYADRLAELTSERLAREKQAVISQLLQRDRQLSEVSGRYWREIDRGNTAFDSRERLADAIQKVTLDQLKTTFRSAMIERQRALLVVTGDEGENSRSVLDQLRQRDAVPARVER